MDAESYDSLFLRIKDSLHSSTDLSSKTFRASQFSSVLKECNNCVAKALDLATKLIVETNCQVNKVCDYIDNVITLLQMLSDFIKIVLESAAITCCNMKLFPTTTGNIILTVFMHCKDSEWVYGHHLKSVETQLKDLFRTCHELQLTYLMTLEKHFVFDLTEKEEQEILIEALNINMRIGEIVQALDIKTMAEQWKAYTIICEKYSNFLRDKNMYDKCTQLLAIIIMDNIKTAMECEQDNKSMMRSLKVANFTIKILSRVSNVFKHAVTNNYGHVVELMEYIYMHNPAFLEQSMNKTNQFVNLVLTNILNPTDGLCTILSQDDRFLDYVYKIDVKTLETNLFLGYIVLITSIIKSVVQMNKDQLLKSSNWKLVDCVYRILPLGHYWFNMGLLFQTQDCSGNENYFGLYEHLLYHVVALAATFGNDHYTLLEKYMCEAVMGTECYAAMFSSNLWLLLIRTASDQLALNTLSSLINIYQTLETHRHFENSPQEVHLSYLIGKIFEILSNENKRVIIKEIHPRNVLWSTLKVSNLPVTLRRNTEVEVFDKLKTSYKLVESQDVTEKDMDDLIHTIKAAATCTSVENDAIDKCVVKLWCKVCYRHKYIELQDLDAAETMWYFNYLEALGALTDCVAHRLNTTSLGKIVHNMSTVLISCNAEIIMLLLELFCKLTSLIEDENQRVIDNIFKDMWTVLWRSVETSMKPYLVNILSKYKSNEKLQEIISKMFCENESLIKEFNVNCDFNRHRKSSEWKHRLLEGTQCEYIHKPRKITIENRLDSGQSINSNFDLGGFLFDEIEEPSRKKPKLEIDDINALIESLENNTSLLCQMDQTALCNYRKRIADVICKLKNIS